MQVWFQNQRAKVKKIQNKARQDGKHKEGGGGDAHADSMDSDSKTMIKVKDENHSKDIF